MPFEPVRMPPIEFPIPLSLVVRLIVAASLASQVYRLLIPSRAFTRAPNRRKSRRFRR